MKNLTGSEKQIKWANDIRESLIQLLSTEYVVYFGDIIKKGDITDYQKDLTEEIQKTLKYILENKTDSKWYIDNRFEIANPIGKAFTFWIRELIIEALENEEKEAEKNKQTEILETEENNKNEVLENKEIIEKEKDFLKTLTQKGYNYYLTGCYILEKNKKMLHMEINITKSINQNMINEVLEIGEEIGILNTKEIKNFLNKGGAFEYV